MSSQEDLILYHCVQARSFRVLWALREMGVSYELVTMPFPPRFTHREFLKTNVLGTIPALLDRSQTPAVLMTESCAAPVYVLNKHASVNARATLQIGPDEADYADYLNWLAHADATLTFPQAVMLRYTKLEPDKGLQRAGEDYGKWFIARLRLLDSKLADGREFLCASRFTLADICILFAIDMGFALGLDAKYSPAIKAWRCRMIQRPAYIASCAEENASLAAFESKHGRGASRL